MQTAMILAAGRGTRLREITERVPKALVEVQGMTMLERTVRRLIGAGITKIVVNVHHHADQVQQFIADRNGFGVEVLISDERDELLDTGGGVVHARAFLESGGPFILHNVDVLTDCDLPAMYRAHSGSGALATLAVMRREVSRYVLVDGEGNVCGRGNRGAGTEEIAREPVGIAEPLGFCGIHIIEPRVFGLMTESGAFSIMDVYMRLLRQGESIAAHDVAGSFWMDIGSPERLQQAQGILDFRF